MEQHHLRRSRALPTHLRGFWVDGISSTQEPCELLRLAAVSRLDHTYSCISAKARRPNGLAKRHLKNAAVLPNIRTAASVSSADVCPSPLCQQEPVSIHGYSVQAYQGIYSSVVEPMMKTRSGRHRSYSLELGLKIKQRLWETLNCPALVETEHPDGRVLITESFSTTNRRSFAPRVHVDISEEPLPEETQRKKTRR
ncbi:putative protein C22orf31-like protein [Labeo rohita]|uniref:Uncharacterized protein n=1 Tax=Labeo rohita TaxID=84645 RepID=A0A498NQW8_LABRO|nr:putative protein C22orf31-like protein [Labeo rohita]RXN34089.1 putative protein C22orf31-like protein [Labeo rohita]